MFTNPLQMAQGLYKPFVAHDSAAFGYKNQEAADALKQRLPVEQHQLDAATIDANHARDAALRNEPKITAEYEKRVQLAKQEAALRHQIDGSPANAPDALLDQQLRAAKGQEDAQLANLKREQLERTITLQNEAANAGLRSGALALAQEKQMEAAIKRTGQNSLVVADQIAAVQLKYHNEQMKRIEDENDLIQKRADTERIAGLTGLPKIEAEGKQRIGDIDDKERKGLYSDQTAPGQASAQAAKERATATAQMYREMSDSQKQYDEELQASIDRNNAAMLTGFQKLDHDLQAEGEARAKKFQLQYGQLAQSSAIYQAAAARDAEAGQSEINNYLRERGELEDAITQKTLEADKQASEAERRVRGEGLDGWLGKYRDTVEEIEAAHTAMIAKIQGEQAKPGVTDAANVQYEKQKVDADRIANAQILDANQQMAHQLAGTLQSAFDDPVHFIQNKMKTMMFEIIADWILQTGAFKNIFGNQMGSLGGGSGSHTGPASGIAGLLGIGGGSAPTGSNGGFSGGGITGLPSSGVSVAAPGFSGASGAGGNSNSSSSIGMLGDIGSLAGISSSGANALGVGNSDPWDDPTQMSSSDPSSPGFHADDSGTGGFAGGASAVGGLIGAGVGAYTGFMGVEGAFESGKASGILTGAMSGAELGASVGMLAGPLGAAIGGAIGAGAGATAGLIGWASGEGNRMGAASYYKTQMQPQMQAVETSYEQAGSGSASDALSQVNTIAQSGLLSIANKYGGTAATWARQQYVDKELQFLTQQINRLARGGHDYLQASAVQFHTGGQILGFGDLSTSSNEGFIHAMLGERIVNSGASSAHAPYIDAMNSGASQAEIASMYLRNSGSSSSGDTHNHYYEGHTIQALDGADFEHYLNHRGGYAAISRAETKSNTRYAGEADYG